MIMEVRFITLSVYRQEEDMIKEKNWNLENGNCEDVERWRERERDCRCWNLKIKKNNKIYIL